MISGANVNAGVATVGSDIFTVEIDEVVPVASGAPSVPINLDSFEINGELYTITPGQSGMTTAPAKLSARANRLLHSPAPTRSN